MFNLKNEKLKLFKKFIIGKDLENIKFKWQDFNIESFKDDKVILDINVNKAFKFLYTEEEYSYIKILNKDKSVDAQDSKDIPITFEKNVKSKLINKIFIETNDDKLNLTFEISVYSRNVLYSRKREYDDFILEKSYGNEYITVTYNTKDSSIKNNLLELDTRKKTVLKSIDGSLDLNLFAQLENLNPRIYFYIYIELILMMKRNNIGSFDVENMLDNILITSNINAKELVLDIFDNKISSDNFKQKLINNTHEDLTFIPLISIYELNLLLKRRGYYFPESSLYEEEFENILNLNESEILDSYNLRDYKGYRELIRVNLENIYHIKKLENKGFKYKEVINILKSLNIYDAKTDTVLDSELLAIYMSKNSKKDVVKKLFSNKAYASNVKDVITMLDKITVASLENLVRCNISRELITYENIDKYFNFNLNIKNLEKEVTEVYNLIDNENFNLYYKEKSCAKSEFFEYNLPNLDYSNSEYLLYQEDDYSLTLPLNSAILKRVGEKLHICVGSYADRIKGQKVVVLFVKKDNEYIGCVELDSKYEKLIQAKIRYNKTFNEQEQSFIYSFCTKNEIDIETNDMYKKYNTVVTQNAYRDFDVITNCAVENRVV